MLRKKEVIAGIAMFIVLGWGAYVGINFQFREIRQKEINDPDGFSEFTWELIRKSVDACGNNQECHHQWMASEFPKYMPLSFYSTSDREKVSRSIVVVTSGKAEQIEPWFVQQKLGPGLYKKLKH